MVLVPHPKTTSHARLPVSGVSGAWEHRPATLRAESQEPSELFQRPMDGNLCRVSLRDHRRALQGRLPRGWLGEPSQSGGGGHRLPLLAEEEPFRGIFPLPSTTFTGSGAFISLAARLRLGI